MRTFKNTMRLQKMERHANALEARCKTRKQPPNKTKKTPRNQDNVGVKKGSTGASKTRQDKRQKLETRSNRLTMMASMGVRMSVAQRVNSPRSTGTLCYLLVGTVTESLVSGAGTSSQHPSRLAKPMTASRSGRRHRMIGTRDCG